MVGLNEAETGSKAKEGPIQTESEDTERISSACCGVLRDIMSPGLMGDLWSSGRGAHSSPERTPARFDVGEWSSRLEMDHRVYVTLLPHFTWHVR